MFFFKRKKFPKRNEFHSSNFNESKARETAHALKKLGYFEYTETDITALEEDLAFHLYEYGIAGTFYIKDGKRIFDYRYISEDGQALMSREGQRSFLDLVQKFLQKRIPALPSWEYQYNKLRFVESIKWDELIFPITGTDRPDTEEDFQRILTNICNYVNHALKNASSPDNIYPTRAGGFYFLTKELVDHFATLPLNEHHRPRKYPT